MRQRCNNLNHKSYYNYGGRGIHICLEWDDFAVFRDWAIRSGYDESAPRGVYTLDRIDVDGPYCPDNCRWADMKTQSVNKRDTIRLECDGSVRTLKEWSDITGIRYDTLWKRYSRGVPPSDILSLPT